MEMESSTKQTGFEVYLYNFKYISEIPIGYELTAILNLVCSSLNAQIIKIVTLV